MAARSIASLSLGFGLVNVPVKLYSATESSATVRFNLLEKDGSRMRQQYVSDKTGKVVDRAEMVKGYEFEKDRFVIFTNDELKAMDEAASHVIEIVAFVPEASVDPLYYDRAYFLAPDKRGGKPYTLLAEAMRASGRCALARWTSKGKQYVVQVRPGEGGLILQQLLYADEVRSIQALEIEAVEVSKSELQLALQLIDQISQDSYDPAQFKDEEKARILAAIDRKIEGEQVVATGEAAAPVASGQVIDLMEALRASLKKQPAKAAGAAAGRPEVASSKDRKAPRRAAKAEPAEAAAAAEEAAPRPARARARK